LGLLNLANAQSRQNLFRAFGIALLPRRRQAKSEKPKEHGMFSRVIMIVGLILTMAVQVAAAEAAELNFGIISTTSPQHLKKAWQPFLADMQKALGIKVHAFYAPNYAGIVKGMRAQKVQVAWFGNKSAIEAVDHASGEVFAQAVPLDGNPGYYSHLIVHRDSALNTLEDVLKNSKKLSFGNGDPDSTSGFLVPSYYIFAKHKIDPKQAFKSMTSANHEANALAVANKQVDVATSNSINLQKFKNSYPDKSAQLKVVWTSPLIPSDPLVWRTDVPEELKSKIRNFILTYGIKGKNREKEKLVLANLAWSSFRPSDNDQLLPVRQLELFKARTRIEADTTISLNEKAKRLATLDAELDELEIRTKR
jgi:phosphonate transport system substrate-binding protein